jgi:hypothetical protein
MRTGQDFMAQNDDLVLYTAQYDNVSAALAELDAVEQLHKDELIGSHDAAVIDEENGKPRCQADGPPAHPSPATSGPRPSTTLW